jgi:hypothetical protein
LLSSGGIGQLGRRSAPDGPVGGHRLPDRRVLGAPAGQQAVERDRIDHRAGQDVGAHLGALLDHHHRAVGRELLEPDRRRQPGRAGSHDHHVDIHRLAGGQFGHGRLHCGRLHAASRGFFPRLSPGGNQSKAAA